MTIEFEIQIYRDESAVVDYGIPLDPGGSRSSSSVSLK